MSPSDTSTQRTYLGLPRHDDRALAELTEVHRRDLAFRGAMAHRALRAILDQMNRDDARTGASRRLLFQH